MSEGLMNGWISLHRKIFSNPILRPKGNHQWSILEAFIWLCLKASYSRQKVVLGNDIFWIEAGQLVTSQLKLRQRFNWSNTKLRGRLQLLEKDDMIKIFTNKKMTRITILKYDTYQNIELKNGAERVLLLLKQQRRWAILLE